jgi:hypothetical protein
MERSWTYIYDGSGGEYIRSVEIAMPDQTHKESRSLVSKLCPNVSLARADPPPKTVPRGSYYYPCVRVVKGQHHQAFGGTERVKLKADVMEEH